MVPARKTATQEATPAGARAGVDLAYPWPRFWVPRDGVIDLSDAGFLRDPTDWLARPRWPVPLAALQQWRALALLGEPGIGKSTTLKEEADRVASLPADANLVSIYIDLRAFSSEELLYRRLFESEKFIAWKNGSSHLFLHLDSLDEALLRIDSIANLFAAELPGLPTDRLSIRIACRTAVWPADTLGVALTRIWGEASGAFELAPLRRRDVFAALEAHGITTEGFMRALFAAQAVPFAIKPLTLKMLLTVYQQRGDLPNSNIELYKQGCLALCEESNKSRRDSGRRGRLNASQRMRLAGRIAAAAILGNRFAVWTGPEVDCPREDILVSALAGGSEDGDFAKFTTTDDDVREVLDTGLFSSRGEHRMGWAHQGYGEFLAALYFFERGVPAETMLKALRHPTGGLIPQLSGVAAWAASLSGALRAALTADEPVALLRGDLSGWSADDRKALVKSLVPTGNPIRLVSLCESVDACGAMIDLCKLMWWAFAGLFRSRAALEAELLVLRHQLNVLRRKSPGRLAFSSIDRLVFAGMYALTPNILDALKIVKPETVLRWHRAGFQAYWRWKSRPRGGRPSTPAEIRDLIREMSVANPLWGAPRIHGELLKLGVDVGQTTVAKYMVKTTRPPSQGWKTFLVNHADGIASMDLFVVPTISFRLLYGFLILLHARRELLWLGVTAHPTAEWIAQQITEAFCWRNAPLHVVRDRDRVYGARYIQRGRAMGIRDRPIAPHSPWQNAYAERLIGSIRRDCLDHIVVVGEPHLRNLLRSYQRYYNEARTHLSLCKDAPLPRAVQARGHIRVTPILGGLHHQYWRI